MGQARLLHQRAVGDQKFVGDPTKTKGASLPARSVTVNGAESPLGWLFARGHLSSRQFEAGEQLRTDWEQAQMAPRMTMRWDEAPISHSRGGRAPALDPIERQAHAKRRFEVAVAAVGPGLTDILWRVVCSGDGMREAEGALGWPARAGKLVLTIALDRLADHYRLPGATMERS